MSRKALGDLNDQRKSHKAWVRCITNILDELTFNLLIYCGGGKFSTGLSPHVR